jgi:Domain of unknown function (DUF5655)/Domain of unknown function (DUF4287)
MPARSFETNKSRSADFTRKTGQSLEEWAKLIKKSGLDDCEARIAWLKSKFKLTPVQAGEIVNALPENFIVSDGKLLLDKHFGEDKAYQKPIYDLLMIHIKRWGPYRLTINKTYLSLIHNLQFAIAKPSKSGLVVGVITEAVKKTRNKDFVPARNLAGEKITHKIILNDEREITTSVLKVIHVSYDLT